MALDLTAATFWTPKEGNTEAEYEDAFFPKDLSDRKGRVLRFAMADGASEGMLSGPWAQILVRSFCRSDSRPTPASARRVIWNSCAAWEMWKTAYLAKREEVGKPVQWWEEEGLANGPFATLLGVAFLLREGADTGRWDAVAMGDTCLFKVSESRGGAEGSGTPPESRGSSGFDRNLRFRTPRPIGNHPEPDCACVESSGCRVTVSFPVEGSSDFNSRPVLLSGDRRRNAPHLGRLVSTGGDFERGDRFYFMTDALAAWFLREVEEGRAPWEEIDRYVSPRAGGGTGDELRELSLRFTGDDGNRASLRRAVSYGSERQRESLDAGEADLPRHVCAGDASEPSELRLDRDGLLEFVRTLRHCGKIRNDDVTLTCIKVV